MIRGPLTEPNQRTGHPAPHPVRQECHHQHHAHLATQASWMLQSSPPHKPRWSPTSNAKPARHVSATSLSRLVPWLGPTEKQTVASLATTDPPTSTPNTTRRALRLWPHQLRVRALLPSTCFPQRHPVNPISSPSGGAVGTDGAHEGGIHCKLCATEEEHAIHHHFQSPGIHHAWLDQVQVSDHHQLPDKPSPQHSPKPTLDLPRLLPAHAARWWPQESSGRPHRQERAVKQGERKTKSAKEGPPGTTGGGIFVSLLVGHVDNANPAPGPPWDLTMAILPASTRVKTSLSLKCDSTREAASCCQPSLHHPGSKSSGSWGAGLTPCARPCHVGKIKIAHSRQLPCRCSSCFQARRSRGAFQLVHHQLSDFGVAFADHGQAVGPTGPVCSLARPQSTPEPQSPQ